MTSTPFLLSQVAQGEAVTYVRRCEALDRTLPPVQSLALVCSKATSCGAQSQMMLHIYVLQMAPGRC
jgi:hypothetical protein